MLATSCASFMSEPLCLFPPLCKLSYAGKAAARPQNLTHSSQVVQGSGCETPPLLCRQSRQYEGLTSETATLPSGHRGGGRGSPVRAHQEWDVAWGVRNNMIVSPGDEQQCCINVLRHGSWQHGETAISSGIQACLGLACSPQEL